MAPPLRAVAVFAAVVIVVAAGIEIYMLSATPGPVTSAVPTQFTVNGRTYTFTYTATNLTEWEAGLMNKKVTNMTTMLFAFSSFERWAFWMYDTNTSLDMIWLNATGTSATVVYLVTAAPPCYDSGTCPNYTPTAPANYVIEAKAGFAASNGIEVGSMIRLG